MTKNVERKIQVIHVPSDYSVVINRGSEHGAKKGDVYLIYNLGEELFDPDDGSSLGQLELLRGRAKIVHVQENFSTLESIEIEKTPQSKKIIKRSNPNAYISILGYEREEVVEEPEEKILTLDAVKGDLARLLQSS